jgi:hypothetical protein
MSATGRLAGFAAILLVVFGGAVAAGGAIGPERDSEAAEGHDAGRSDEAVTHGGDTGAGEHATDTHDSGETADPVRGLAVSEDGLALVLRQRELPRGRPAELRFSIVGSNGRPLRAFEVEHEKRMHLIVVRRDGRGFQHLHPELGADGVWRVRLTLPAAGSYRVFADFKHDGEAQTLAADLAVDGDARYRPLPAEAATATTEGGYRVRLDAGALQAGREAELRFGVSRGGEAIRPEPYLGAGGHLVALREGDLAYLHVHPAGPGERGPHAQAVSFATEFPTEGRYRLYLQFKHEGRVHTAEFTQEVAR